MCFGCLIILSTKADVIRLSLSLSQYTQDSLSHERNRLHSGRRGGSHLHYSGPVAQGNICRAHVRK